MAIHRLQEKIRKMKNPTVVNFSMLPEHIPGQILENSKGFLDAKEQYSLALLSGLQDVVPAVRFSFLSYALAGAEGLQSLVRILQKARELDYYILLEGVDALSAQDAEIFAKALMDPDNALCFDGIILSAYIGSDALRPYLSQLKDSGKDLFVVVRTANKTAAELQDLLTGTRLMHMAKADIVNRFTQPLITRCGYSQIAVMAGASSADSLQTLREKYKDIFILVDGCDYPNANAKNCSFAFDKLGHGAAACAGLSVLSAWQETEGDCVELAVQAAQRLKKNLTRYITIL